jgi:hypothetical protein
VAGEPRRARASVCVVFGVCGAAFATWAARVPAAQHRLGLTPGQLAIALFGLAAGAVVALAGSGALITRAGSRAGAAAGAAVLGLGLALIPAAGDLPFFVAALFVLGVGNGLLDVSMNAHAARVERASASICSWPASNSSGPIRLTCSSRISDHLVKVTCPGPLPRPAPSGISPVAAPKLASACRPWAQFLEILDTGILYTVDHRPTQGRPVVGKDVDGLRNQLVRPVIKSGDPDATSSVR